MSDNDEQSEDDLDDFDKAARLNFRDYPSISRDDCSPQLRAWVDALQMGGTKACRSARRF